MTQDIETLTGALIGLVRAADGNELVTGETHRLLADGLALTGQEDPDPIGVRTMIARVRGEKHRLVPDCSVCASPCGRTADYDMHLLTAAEPSVCALKEKILSGAQALASHAPLTPDAQLLLERALFAVGEDCGDDYLASLSEELDSVL